MSTFFIKDTAPALNNETPDIATKRIILHVAGDFTTDPATLSETLKLKANLKYGTVEYALLQSRLDEYVKGKSGKRITTAETNACEKVKDCVQPLVAVFGTSTLQYLHDYKDTSHSAIVTSYWQPEYKYKGQLHIGGYLQNDHLVDYFVLHK